MARFAIAPILALLALFTLSLAPADEVTPSPPTPVPGTAQAPPFFHVPQSRSEESKSHEVANPRLLPPRPPTIQASSAPSTFRTEDNTPLEDAAKTQLRSARPDHPRSGKSRLAPRTPVLTPPGSSAQHRLQRGAAVALTEEREESNTISKDLYEPAGPRGFANNDCRRAGTKANQQGNLRRSTSSTPSPSGDTRNPRVSGKRAHPTSPGYPFRTLTQERSNSGGLCFTTDASQRMTLSHA